MQDCKIEMFEMADLANALKELKKSKSAGLDGLSSEHFIYADVSINKLLIMLFNSIIVQVLSLMNL